MGRASSSILGVALDDLVATTPKIARIAADPVEFPRRYSDPRDAEVAGLLAASLAYGRADLFKPKVDQLLRGMGSSPAAFVVDLSWPRARKLLSGFVYRFNVAADVGALLFGMRRQLRDRGSLEALFAGSLDRSRSLFEALGEFTRELRRVDLGQVRRHLGPERGLGHLVPSPLGPGAAKRLNLFLRWMVRGPDGVDLGIWRRVAPRELVIPLDVHVARVALRVGLTRRKDLSWKTALEVTRALGEFDAEDPVRYDFALCHLGMSGVCSVRPEAVRCTNCPLVKACGVGRRLARKGPRSVRLQPEDLPEPAENPLGLGGGIGGLGLRLHQRP